MRVVIGALGDGEGMGSGVAQGRWGEEMGGREEKANSFSR